ncbi:hypothetical protein D3C80_1569440 [compost metagenome]
MMALMVLRVLNRKWGLIWAWMSLSSDCTSNRCCCSSRPLSSCWDSRLAIPSPRVWLILRNNRFLGS